MSIEGQGHFFTIYFPGFVCLCFTRPRYQVSVYRTIDPLVLKQDGKKCSHYFKSSVMYCKILVLFHISYIEGPGSATIK